MSSGEVSISGPPPAAACAGCSAVPPRRVEPVTEGPQTLFLSLPGIHCQNCIAGVETALSCHPDVASARVNLTLKRVQISAQADADPEELISLLATRGYEAHALDPDVLAATGRDTAGRDLLMRLAVAGFASMNVMLLSVSVWSGAADATRDMFHWISAAIALPAIAFCAQPFFKNAWSALRVGRLNMDVPIVLAILLALVTSVWETALSGKHAYFDAALTLTFFLLIGRYLDYRARSAARSAAQELSALEVPRVRLVREGQEVEVAASEVAVSDIVHIRPGGRIPIDGVVIDGRSELDRSLLTGETLPVVIAPGQTVSAGEINLTGPLLVRATMVGPETSLHKMAELVAVAESGRSRYTSLADRAAKLYAPGVHILSALSFLGWLLYSGDVRVSLNIAAAVLIITCPCALGLAVPAVTTAASGLLFRKGLLIKDPTALERLAQVDTVVFDKTGTLTHGTPVVEGLSDIDPSALGLARALAECSVHPLSVALAKAIADADVPAAQVTDISERPGYGLEGYAGGQSIRLGRADWVGAPVSDDTRCWLQIGGAAPIGFSFSDTLRPGAQDAVAALQRDNKSVILLSGDAPAVVEKMAAKLGIETWKAQVSPAEKAQEIKALQQSGRNVLMVGDGLNDTVALTQANASIAPASALDAARVASDIVLLGQDLSPVADACRVARKATARIRENFRIATVYNIIAVPLAFAGLATPLIAALAMSLSSVTVSVNALRVR